MKNWSLLLLLVIGMFLLAACGGGESVTEPTSLEFKGNDNFQFIPDNASADAGAQLKVTLNNIGNLDHSWVLVNEDADVATVTEEEAINNAATGIVPPGEFRFVIFTVPESGNYKFVCTIPGHAAAGMVGPFIAN